MKKVWVYKRKNITGWWVGWYESGRRKAKALPNKSLAEHYRSIKYAQLNSEVFTGTVSLDWKQLNDEYLQSKRVAGLVESSIYEISLTVRNFERLFGALQSRQVTQKVVDEFVLKRGREVGRSTLNKDIRNLHAFINWGKEQKYFNHKLKLKQLKEEDRPVKSLSAVQVRRLLQAAKEYPNIRMRLLLVLGTALRRGDTETIKVKDVDVTNNSITTRSKKTKKGMSSRPVPEVIMKQIGSYMTTLPDGQERLISDRLSQRQWNRVRRLAGLPDLKFHDLRKTFASSLAQRGISTAVTQRLLEHSSPNLTNKVYINVDPVLRHAVEQLPVDEWLREYPQYGGGKFDNTAVAGS